MNKRGGARTGSGRPRSDSAKKMVTFRLSLDVIEYLESCDRLKIEIVEEALREHKANHSSQ